MKSLISSSDLKRQFKQLPNYQPVGMLFDANHLDLFIRKQEYIKTNPTPLGEYVSKSDFVSQSVDKLAIAREYSNSQHLKTSQIRPSSSFLCQSRDSTYY